MGTTKHPLFRGLYVRSTGRLSFRGHLILKLPGDANTNTKVYIIKNIPTPKRSHREKLIPIVILKINIINGVKLPRPFLCLLDSGSTGCLINRKSMPFVSKTIRTKHATVSTITQYTYSCDEVVFLEDIQMMKFTNSRHIKGVGVHVFDSPTCLYDCILGRDSLRSIGLLLDIQNDSVA